LPISERRRATYAIVGGGVGRAVGRELLGFVWAIGIKAETAGKLQMAA